VAVLGDLGITSSFALKAMNDHWDAIVQAVPVDLLPVDQVLPLRERYRKKFGRVFYEYGCGHYGCVFPTQRENVVLKVTTDPTEATFVKAALEIAKQRDADGYDAFPKGIVKYFGLLELPSTHRKRGIFLIWREEAYNVGEWVPSKVGRFSEMSYEQRALIEFERRLVQFKSNAHAILVILKRAKDPSAMIAQAKNLKQWAWDNFSSEDVEWKSPQYYGWSVAPEYGSPQITRHKGAYAVAARFRACEIAAEMMANEPGGTQIGEAFEFYLEHNIILADVHTQNIGYIKHPDYDGMVLAITDPGHAVFY
jgi:hypothetical protein